VARLPAAGRAGARQVNKFTPKPEFGSENKSYIYIEKRILNF